MADLFDDVERTDADPAWPAEDSFSFLNRAAGPVWERQRRLLDEWYKAFPDETGDLRRRFREADPRQHYAAWWELYVHALLRALGCNVIVHPEVPGTDGRPDFLAEHPDGDFYVEAATVFSGIVSPSRQSRARIDIEDTIARLDSSKFWVSLRVDRVGTSMPAKRSIRKAISDWTEGLDPDEVASADPIDENAWTEFTFGDWIISLRPGLWQPSFRGCPQNRFLGMRTGLGGFVDDIPRLRNAITRKGKQYGTPDKPLVVAVLAANGFVGDREVEDALFGSQSLQVEIATEVTRLTRNPDGVWISKRGAARRRISGVLVGSGILPHTVTRGLPTLWHHFAPTYELGVDLPFRSVRVVGETLEARDATTTASDLFCLPVDWPGPEPPFEPCKHRPEDHPPAQVPRA